MVVSYKLILLTVPLRSLYA